MRLVSLSFARAVPVALLAGVVGVASCSGGDRATSPDATPSDGTPDAPDGAPDAPGEVDGPGRDASDAGPDGGDAASEAPLGLPMAADDVTRVGVASVDITPEVEETFTDLNDNGRFDGCPEDPDASEEGCDEPFDDVNGNGRFDAVWIGGFGPSRAAKDVHDPLSVRTMVVVRNGEYLILTGLDLVGLLHNRIDEARSILAEENGIAPRRFVAATSHTHQGPDSFGIWGYGNFDDFELRPGYDEAYQERLVEAMVQSVREAAERVEPAELVMGMEDMAERSRWFNGRHFGGDNPDPRVHGLINDKRDPVLASTRVFVMHARDPSTGEGIGTLLNFSSHPETWGSDNRHISADWVGVARDRIDAALGGRTVFMPESLGGMQSMLGASIPKVDDEGEWVWETPPDGEGEAQPVWAEEGTWAYVRSAGMHVGAAALDAVASGEVVTPEPFRVRRAPIRVPIDNDGWAVGAQLELADFDPSFIDTGAEACPEIDATDPLQLGCVETDTWRLRLGPLAVMTAPGELLPELFHPFPDDEAWATERTEASARGSADGRDARYFPQHPPACDDVEWSACRDTDSVGDCDCLAMHAVPYRRAPNGREIPPLRSLLPEEADYRIAMSNTGSYLSYIIPVEDFHHGVSLIQGSDGDHYEDTVSASSLFAIRLQEAQLELGDGAP